MATDTMEVSQTSTVSGVSKFSRATSRYRAAVIAWLTRYERPLATIIMTRIMKIQTRSCTCTVLSGTASRMNEISATPVTP